MAQDPNSDREELAALRRMAQLEAKASGGAAPAQPATIASPVGSAVKGALKGAFMPIQAGIESMKLLEKGADVVGSGVTEVASQSGLPPQVAAGLGTAANVGVQSIPAVGGGRLATMAAPAMEDFGRLMMGKAINADLKYLRNGKAAEAIDTMLKEGLNPTMGGLDTLKARIGKLNDEIKHVIENSPETVDKIAVGRHLQNTLDKFTKQVNPNADIAKIRAAWDEFINHPMLQNAERIPVQLAQDLKQGTYRILNKKYGELGGAETEAQKSLARGLKDEIAAVVPEVAGLNAQESKLLTALSVVEKRALKDAGKSFGGITWLSHNPGAWAAFMADKSTLFKSLVARMVHSRASDIPNAAAGTGIAVAEDANTLINRR